ncbi:MAG: dUTP diphosphatase, partial [Clostridia bacterium]|nr:dUTP diphosphatase [Clostridia bacterium]
IGVIDSDYRGEIFFSSVNLSSEPYTVTPGERICQMMLMPVFAMNFTEVESLDETLRGAGGFGSTGNI